MQLLLLFGTKPGIHNPLSTIRDTSSIATTHFSVLHLNSPSPPSSPPIDIAYNNDCDQQGGRSGLPIDHMSSRRNCIEDRHWHPCGVVVLCRCTLASGICGQTGTYGPNLGLQAQAFCSLLLN